MLLRAREPATFMKKPLRSYAAKPRTFLAALATLPLALGAAPPLLAQGGLPPLPGQQGTSKGAAANAAPPATPASGQPMPRFASLKSDRVNVRRGPGTDHGIDWVYRRAGLPIEVIAESEIWRRVRDADGGSGWVLNSLVSNRRTALIEPWEAKANATPPQVSLKSDDRDSASEVAKVEAGVIVNVRTCDGRWCYVGVGELRGYIEQRRLWGVYKGETVR